MYREALIRNTYQAMVYEEPDGKSTTLAENHPAYMTDRDVYRNKSQQQPNSPFQPDDDTDGYDVTNATHMQTQRKILKESSNGQNDSSSIAGVSSAISNNTSKNEKNSQGTSVRDRFLLSPNYEFRNPMCEESIASWADEDGDSFFDDVGSTDTETLIAQAVRKSLNSSYDDELVIFSGKNRRIMTPTPLSGEKHGHWRHVSKGKGRGQQRSVRNRNKGYDEKLNAQMPMSGRFDALVSSKKTRK